MNRTGVPFGDFLGRLEVGAARAVPALIRAFEDVAVRLHAFEDLLHRGYVLLVAGADEEVVACLKLRHQRAKTLGVLVGQRLRLNPLCGGGQRYRLTMLIGAGQKEDVVATLTVVASEHVGGDRRVGVPQMGGGVDVVDRCSYVESGPSHRAER